jgi:predicted Rdx family selenoprotein
MPGNCRFRPAPVSDVFRMPAVGGHLWTPLSAGRYRRRSLHVKSSLWARRKASAKKGLEVLLNSLIPGTGGCSRFAWTRRASGHASRRGVSRDQALKQPIRDRVAPGKELGHSDRPYSANRVAGVGPEASAGPGDAPETMAFWHPTQSEDRGFVGRVLWYWPAVTCAQGSRYRFVRGIPDGARTAIPCPTARIPAGHAPGPNACAARTSGCERRHTSKMLISLMRSL